MQSETPNHSLLQYIGMFSARGSVYSDASSAEMQCKTFYHSLLQYIGIFSARGSVYILRCLFRLNAVGNVLLQPSAVHWNVTRRLDLEVFLFPATTAALTRSRSLSIVSAPTRLAPLGIAL